MPKEEAEYSHKEIIETRRNANNYAADVAALNVLETGIRSACLFNDLSHFSALQNFSVHILHDVFKRIIKYDVCQSLLLYINVKNIRSRNYKSKKNEFSVWCIRDRTHFCTISN